MNNTYSVQAEKTECLGGVAPSGNTQMSPSFEDGAHLATLLMIALALVAACLDDSLIKKEILKGAHPAACGLCTVGMSWFRRICGEREPVSMKGSSRITLLDNTDSPPEREPKRCLRIVPRVAVAFPISRSAGVGAQDGRPPTTPLLWSIHPRLGVSIPMEVAG